MNIAGYTPAVLTHEYTLNKAPDITWTFRKTTWGDEHALEQELNKARAKGENTWALAKVLQLYYSFHATSLTNDDGSPVFRGKPSFREFSAVVTQFPLELLDELWEQAAIFNPQWGSGWDQTAGESAATSEST